MPRRFLPPIALLAFVCFVLPVAADPAAPLPRPSNLRSDILYTHRGEFVQVKPMRALTLNAHVSQFAYDPLGLEIAVVGSETSGNQTTDFVKTLDAHTGKEISRLAVTAPTDDKNTSFMLTGWSQSGKYLLVEREMVDPENADKVLDENLRWDLSADPPTTSTIQPQSALPPEQQSPDLIGSVNCYLSPDGRWLAFAQSIHTQTADGKLGPNRNVYLLYDTEHNKFLPLALPPNTSLRPWIDSTHLKFWQGTERKRLDIVTGQISPLSHDAEPDPPVTSKIYPDLSLDTQMPDQVDPQNSGGHLESNLIWIRRTPFGRMPLGAAAAGLMPSYRDHEVNSDPQAVWSPTGKQVAFIASGDLHVTDLVSASEALPREKLAVGLKLSCQEEQELAASNLKQIGLGIIQYVQDNDEKFPTADGWIKTIYPYIQSPDVFGVGGHPAVYEQPADLSLAKMESPAITEEAYIDLPCARVVLFCDGHVKVFAK